MKKALISTIEAITNFDGSTGFRIAQVENENNIFEVAEGLYWIDCNDDVVADLYYFDTSENVILPTPSKPQSNDPATKLKNFLIANPDISAIIG